MERYRCTRCRNPIRSGSPVADPSAADEWFHPDCWVDVVSARQNDYHQSVEELGLSALLAPYATAAAKPAS